MILALRLRQPAPPIGVRLRGPENLFDMLDPPERAADLVAVIGPAGPRGEPGPAGEAADPGDLILYLQNGMS